MNLGVRFDNFNLVLEIHWAVTFHLKLLGVRLADHATSSHVNKLGEKLILSRIDNWEGMDRDQNLVSVTVNPHRVVIVLVLVDCGRELNIDVFGYACRDHAFLLVPYFEVARLRGQNVQPLWRRRVVNESKFHRVRFICLETRKFDDTGRSAEDAIGANSIVHVFLGNAQTLVCLCLGDQPPLNLNLVLTVRRRLAPQTLFKMLSTFVISM